MRGGAQLFIVYPSKNQFQSLNEKRASRRNAIFFFLSNVPINVVFSNSIPKVRELESYKVNIKVINNSL